MPPPFSHYWHAARGPEVDTSGRIDLATVRRAWSLARPYRRRLAGFLALTVVASFVTLLPPLLIREVIDRGIEGEDVGLLTWLFVAMIAVGLVVAGLGLAERYLSASIGEGFIADLRNRLFDHVQRMPLAFFTRTQTGALITRLNNDVVGAQRALTGTLGSIVQNVIGVGMTVAVMAVLSWQITLLALGLLPLFVVPARWVGTRLQRLTREHMQLNAEMNSLMTERFNVSGALLTKLFGRPADESARFGDRVGRVAGIGVRTAMYGRGLFISLGLIATVATALVYFVGGRTVIATGGDVGTVVALGLYVTQIYRPLTELSNTRVDLLTALVSFERVFEVLDLPHAVADADGAVELERARGHVVFDDVTFRYPAAVGSTLESLEGPRSEHGDEESGLILERISFEAKPGEMVALVGPSGAGKTTIAMLVPRIHHVTSGRLLLDGHDVRELTLSSVNAAVGVVTQDPHLFHDSIAANLRYAKPDATDEELVGACRAARIRDTIARLPDGYDTIVGERGYRLSGGEKQRVAIARVMLKDPAVVVLDEATAHLDSESERLVQIALKEILRDRTSIVIAHRLSTVVDADQIVVVDQGRIVARGTHVELVARGGLYAELARTQLATAEAV
ncbi:MAG: ABC transporter ATP-binding protein [Nitriliruptorales bacterium]